MPVTMRNTPTVILTGAASNWQLYDGANQFPATDITIVSNLSGCNTVVLQVTSSGLTQYRAYVITTNNQVSALMGLSSEL